MLYHLTIDADNRLIIKYIYFYCQPYFISYDPFNNLINNSFMNMFRSNAAFL